MDPNSSPDQGPFRILDRFAPFALGYGALWALLLLLAESGGAELATALAVLVASSMTVLAVDRMLANLRLDVKEVT